MQDTTDSKHAKDEKDDQKKEIKHAKGKLKNDSAEALDEHQWHKHPGGG